MDEERSLPFCSARGQTFPALEEDSTHSTIQLAEVIFMRGIVLFQISRERSFYGLHTIAG